MDNTNSGSKLSDTLMMRAGAMIIDGIIIAVANSVITSVLSPLYATSPDNLYSMMSNIRMYVAINIVISTLVFLAYFGFLEGKAGQASIGKRLLGFALQKEDGSTPDIQSALKHAAPFAGCYLLTILPGVGALLSFAAWLYLLYTTYQDPENRGWHDRFSRCKVVKVK